MDLHLDISTLTDLTGGHLDGPQKERALGHLDGCAECRAVLATLVKASRPELTPVVGTRPIPRQSVPKYRRAGSADPTEVVDPISSEAATHMAMDPLIGARLGDYVIDALISRGGMGAVYQGSQPVIGKRVAIKVLLPEAEEPEETARRLLEEARVVNSIRHPNIVDIFGFGALPDGRPWMVMELLEGPTLNLALREQGPLPLHEALAVLEAVAAALEAAHAAGVIHRDLKPANVFVEHRPDSSLRVKVLDFGFAKNLVGTLHTAPNIIFGTPGAMAPEQIQGKAVTPRSDLYALGVLAWELLTAEEPFPAADPTARMRRQLVEDLPPLTGVPEEVAALVAALTQRQPERRPANAGEVRRTLARLLRTHARRGTEHALPSAAPAEPLAAPPTQRARLRPPSGAQGAGPSGTLLEDESPGPAKAPPRASPTPGPSKPASPTTESNPTVKPLLGGLPVPVLVGGGVLLLLFLGVLRSLLR